MITKQGDIPVEYTVDQVFSEATKSKHLPKNIGILKLDCKDSVLRRNTVIQARIGFLFFKFGMDARISEFEYNQTLYLAGSTRDAEMNLAFDFQPTVDGNATNVAYNFNLDLKSSVARSAEVRFGSNRTHELIGGVVLGIVDNVQRGLDATYAPFQRPA